MSDEKKYYDLEHYLFTEVHGSFHDTGGLSAFDFFCIVIWKANRAKSKVATKLLSHAEYATLEEAVRALTEGILNAESNEARLKLLMVDWGFLLPMSTAILTVLYPDDFTVFDVRVCELLPQYKSLQNKTSFARIWPMYCKFMKAVYAEGHGKLSLRDCDRLLWSRSFADQLRSDIVKGFKKPEEEG